MTWQHDPTREDRSDVDSRLVDAAWGQFERVRAVAAHSSSDVTRASGAGGSAALLPSESFPGYVILGEIHRGGQGVVYQAIQESTRRKVAIKVLRDGPLAEATELARFDREVAVLALLRHPHIVTIHDRGQFAGRRYYVMDYIAGRPLDAHIAVSELSVGETLELFLKICDAVSEAHLRGVIHRDLKPGNIRIDEQGQPRILDFGLAKLTTVDESGPTMTQTGQFVGSLPWASPEQADGRGDLLDIRTDVYSLGVILFQMLTGAYPYPVFGSMREVVGNITSAVPLRPSTLRRGIDADVETIVLKCLSKEPARRYQSAGELARDVGHYLAGEPIAARRDSFGYVASKLLRRHRLPVSFAAALLVVLVGGLATSLTFWRQAEGQRILAEANEARALAAAQEAQEVTEFQAFMLADINPEQMGAGLRAELLDAAHRSLAPADGAEGTDEEIQRFVRLLDEVNFTNLALHSVEANIFDRALVAIDERFADRPLVRARMLQTLATTLGKLGLLQRATGPQEEALALRRAALGDDHPDTLNSISRLGALLMAQGKLAPAEVLFREAVEGDRRVRGDDHPETLVDIGSLAAALQSLGRWSEAEPLYRESLERSRRVLGENDPITLNAVNNMGFLLRAQSRLAEAEPYYRAAAEARRRLLGDLHPDTLVSINNMAYLLQAQGKYAEAEEGFREVLAARRSLFGDDHPRTITSINNLGMLYWEQRRLTEAEPLLRAALEGSRRVLGDAHPDTHGSTGNMGLVLYAQGRYHEAEPYYRESYELSRRLVGEMHRDTLQSARNLGALLYQMGRLGEAAEFAVRTLEDSRQLLGDAHDGTLRSMILYANVLLAQDRVADAEPYLREAHAGLVRLFGKEHPETLRAVQSIGFMLACQERHAESEQYFREAFEGRSRANGADHPDALASMNSLGVALAQQGRLDEGEELLLGVLERRRAILGDEHPDTLVSVNNVGYLHALRGRLKEAEAYYREALETRRRVLGAQHYEVGVTCLNLGALLLQEGRCGDAEELLLEAHAIFVETWSPAHQRCRSATARLAELYETWEQAEPGGGHDVAAAAWRAALVVDGPSGP
ncbi:MAG: tetratricopeptide repeat protein [Phycisphaerales bacterium]|nr:tetratricopeptide repeat protein [Phycisphaerales bacterium]